MDVRSLYYAYKRGVTGSNPVAPTKFLQLGGLFETLIGDPVTTAGNHRCMLPDREGCPAAMAACPPTTRARRADARLLHHVLDAPPQFGAPPQKKILVAGGLTRPLGRRKIAGTASSVT